MALEKYDIASSIEKSKKTASVLDEETYTENLERIIVRDFFPDYGKLKDQKEYLEAEEKKDFEKMREIALKYSRGQNSEQTPNTEPGTKIPLPSPATFETPIVEGQCPPSVKVSRNQDKLNQKAKQRDNNLGYEKDDIGFNEEGEVKESDAGDGLNSFLSKYTSEDNESFENIMERADEARRQKYAWLYEAEIKHAENQKQMLMLQYDEKKDNSNRLAIKDRDETEVEKSDCDKPDNEHSSKALVAVESRSEETAEESSAPVTNLVETEEDRQSKTVDTWTYKAKNHLMYYPEGLPNDDALFKKPYEITHSNTRFQNDPFKDALDRNKLVEAAAENAKFSVGERVGHDGKAIIPTASPSVNGYGFVATPSPAPGVNMSPVMTWGVVEGTPARLDPSGTPTPGPSFKFPKESYRDQLMYKMVDENTKKNRAKKQAALRQVKESVLAGTPRRVGSIMSSERINTLSPAARRLVAGNKKLGIASDIRLKDSYTPTPSNRSKRGDLTPISKTPTPNTRSRATPKGSGSNTPSITDNLLNIPSKKKKTTASDFF